MTYLVAMEEHVLDIHSVKVVWICDIHGSRSFKQLNESIVLCPRILHQLTFDFAYHFLLFCYFVILYSWFVLNIEYLDSLKTPSIILPKCICSVMSPFGEWKHLLLFFTWSVGNRLWCAYAHCDRVQTTKSDDHVICAPNLHRKQVQL